MIHGVLQYLLLIVGLRFTDTLKKNYYEKNPGDTNKPLLNVEMTNRMSEGQTENSNFIGTSV